MYKIVSNSTIFFGVIEKTIAVHHRFTTTVCIRLINIHHKIVSWFCYLCYALDVTAILDLRSGRGHYATGDMQLFRTIVSKDWDFGIILNTLQEWKRHLFWQLWRSASRIQSGFLRREYVSGARSLLPKFMPAGKFGKILRQTEIFLDENLMGLRTYRSSPWI